MATMASATPAARDISKTSGRDNLAVVAARSVPTGRTKPLPTPPNSMSPALPPHGFKAQLQKADKLEPIDSDIDLHETSTECDSVTSGSNDATGAITPSLLAKYHLPEILVNHGPLAIRHIMGYLTTSVPGFAGIPPPKARRLVVAALEGRGQGHHLVENASTRPNVVFEKVGWGRWDAKQRRQTSPGMSSRSYPTGIPISSANRGAGTRPRLGTRNDSTDVMAFSHDDRDDNMMENEADKMSLDSLDGPVSASCSEAEDSEMAMDDDPEDATDDEDWGAVGAAALRAASYSSPVESRMENNYQASRSFAQGGFRSISHGSGMLREPRLDNIDLEALAASSDAQERDAIQALLQLGSV